MRILHVFLFISSLTTLGQAQVCDNDRESLFEIGFDVTSDDFSQLGSFSWELQHDNGTMLHEDWYVSFFDVPKTTVQLCIPKEDCIMLHVEDLQTNQFTIQVDGEAITPGLPIFHEKHGSDSISTTELGGDSCIPTCQSDEALLDVAAFHVYQSAFEWRIEDATNGEELLACQRVEYDHFYCGKFLYSFGLYHSRRCLPIDGCYRVVLSDKHWREGAEYVDPTWLFFNITFNDEKVESVVDDFKFRVMYFGQCSSEVSSCKKEEAIVELFVWRQVFFDSYPDLSWEFKHSSNETTLLDGVIPWNGTTLLYVHECVPSDACLTFSISVPETNVISRDEMGNTTYDEQAPYRLTVDGVLFVDGDYRFDADDSYFLETTAIGHCVAADLCDTGIESLFDLQLETGSVDPHHVSWRLLFDVDERDFPSDHVAWSRQWFDDFSSESLYRTYYCIPKKQSIYFKIQAYSIHSGNQVSRYTISVDGEILEDCREESCEGDMITRLSGGDSQLSAGAIAGIVVGSVVALVLVALVGYKLYAKKKASTMSPSSPDSPRDEEEAARESK